MIKIAKAPAFQFYPADFVSDENVAAMTNHERGCYIMLICFCWKEGSIPSSIKSIARILRETESDMMILWQAIAPCFVPGDDGDRLRHPRLDAEREKQAAYQLKKSEAGKTGMRKRWGNRQEKPLPLWEQEGINPTAQISTPTVDRIGIAPPSDTQTCLESTCLESKPKKTKQNQHIDIPEGVNPEIYADFIKVRTRKSAPFTATALNGFIAEAKKANITLDEAFSVCCNKGWVGFDAKWYANLSRSQTSRTNYPMKTRVEDTMSNDEYRSHMLKQLGVVSGEESVDMDVDRGVIEMQQEVLVHGQGS